VGSHWTLTDALREFEYINHFFNRTTSSCELPLQLSSERPKDCERALRHFEHETELASALQGCVFEQLCECNLVRGERSLLLGFFGESGPKILSKLRNTFRKSAEVAALVLKRTHAPSQRRERTDLKTPHGRRAGWRFRCRMGRGTCNWAGKRAVMNRLLVFRAFDFLEQHADTMEVGLLLGNGWRFTAAELTRTPIKLESPKCPSS
jgi:hypothetical protein